MKKQIVLLLFLPCLLIVNAAIGQGCSDAGICTVSSLKPELSDNTSAFKNQIKLGASWGIADNDIMALGQYIEFSRAIGNHGGFDIRVTSLAQMGNDISVFGLGDILAQLHYELSEEMRLTLGAKLPLNAANRSKDNLPLPMDYQSSLGTYDLIAGLSYTAEKFLVAIGYQHPLSQNSNLFNPTRYDEDSPLRNFANTVNFNRSADVMLRVAYLHRFGTAFRFSGGLQPIYHVGEDSRTDDLGKRVYIENSDGLTLNANAGLAYYFGRHSIQLGVAAPLVVREARPDGLTRGLLVMLEYRTGF